MNTTWIDDRPNEPAEAVADEVGRHIGLAHRPTVAVERADGWCGYYFNGLT